MLLAFPCSLAHNLVVFMRAPLNVLEVTVFVEVQRALVVTAVAEDLQQLVVQGVVVAGKLSDELLLIGLYAET